MRAFFNIYYRVSFWCAIGAALSYWLWGRAAFGIGCAGIALFVVGLRKYLLRFMEHLGDPDQGRDDAAIRRFKRVHVAALGINFGLLAFLVWGLITLSRSISGPTA